MTLYEIKEEYLKALEQIDINEDGEIMNLEAIESVKGEFTEKAEATAIYIKNLKAEAEAIHSEIENLKAREKALLNKIKNLIEYLAMNIKACGMDKFKTIRCVVSSRKSEAVEIENEAEFCESASESYVTTTITKKPDKKAIKDALKGGEDVPGAKLEVRENWSVK